MTTKLEFLKHAIQLVKPLEHRDFMVMMITVPLLKDNPNWKELPLYSLTTQADGIYYVASVNEQPTLVKIEDYKKEEPLFYYNTPIEIDNQWLGSVKGKLTTTFGRLILNALCLYPSVGDKIPYINVKTSQSDIEAMLASRVKNDEDLKPGDISVQEMITCIDRLNFLMSYATFTNVGATRKTITAPTGIKEYKAKLLKEYEGRLDDPVTLVEFQKKLEDFDAAYLADDTAAKHIFNKKTKVGRAKMHLAYGNTLDFVKGKTAPVVLDSLSDGISTDPNELAKHMNDLRYGSFSRGSSTALSGYAYKVLQSSLSGVSISKTPCNTTKGLIRNITADSYKKLIGRYIKTKGWQLVETAEQAKAYLGKTVEMRSTLYCLSPGNTVCYACMGESYKNQQSGISNLAAGISAVFMSTFLKLMHGVTTNIAEVELEDFCS